MKLLRDKGWDETVQALGVGVAVGAIAGYVYKVYYLLKNGATLLAALMLTGCGSVTVLGKYQHDSSAEDFYDANTADMLGGCVRAELCRDCGDLPPEMEVCALVEVTDKEVFGSPPTGQISIEKPIKKWRR